jgi:hypothetical protein
MESQRASKTPDQLVLSDDDASIQSFSVNAAHMPWKIVTFL